MDKDAALAAVMKPDFSFWVRKGNTNSRPLLSSFQAEPSSEKIAPHRQGRNVGYVIGESSPSLRAKVAEAKMCLCAHLYQGETCKTDGEQVKVVRCL